METVMALVWNFASFSVGVILGMLLGVAVKAGGRSDLEREILYLKNRLANLTKGGEK